MAKVPAADATLAVLSHLAAQPRPLPAGRIASALGIPRSTTYDLLGVMVARGFVIHYEQDHTYGLGAAAHELSAGYSRQTPLAVLGRRVADALALQLRESVHIAVLHGRDVLYVVESRAQGRPSLVTDVGVRLPAHLTASGMAMLAALPAAQVRALYAGISELEVRDGWSSSLGYSTARMLADLRVVTEDGHATEEGSVTPGLDSLAVPVLDALGWPRASVAVTYASETATEGFVDALHRAAVDLGRVFGS